MAILVGTAGMEVNLDARLILGGQRRYVGSLGAVYPEKDFIKFLEFQKEDLFKLRKIITNEYKLREINEACRDLRNKKILGRGIIIF